MKNNESSSGEMSFWDHLEDLRKSIFRVCAVLLGTFSILFFFKRFLFEEVILAPTFSDFYLYRLIGNEISLSLVNIELTAQFMVHMKVAFLCALILSFPYLVFEIWRYIAPALYKKEKDAVRKALAFTSILFYLGLAVGYFIVLPLMLNFFANYQVSELVVNTFSLSSYISLLNSTVLIFGIVFQFPTIIAVLSSLGVVTKKILKNFRRHAVCLILILAAVITPSGDPFSLIICSIPLYLLYEFSILICKKGE